MPDSLFDVIPEALRLSHFNAMMDYQPRHRQDHDKDDTQQPDTQAAK
ncbi:MAG: hypothetical protein Q8P24_14930 [Desulfobacterales bacterium]|nr:hypothetical protein [Desulfobacterales bacterium]